jgi:hypothetical protein
VVRAMAEELLVVESLDADGIRAVIAQAALPRHDSHLDW